MSMQQFCPLCPQQLDPTNSSMIVHQEPCKQEKCVSNRLCCTPGL
uniref:Uncharacterized protein n=1 Tax=Arundo donax TaxID=35708 RepID=A0A0A9G8I0_ARUDO